MQPETKTALEQIPPEIKAPPTTLSKKYPSWFWGFAALVLLLSSLPYLFGWLNAPPESLYLGVHSAVDDQAVYASWIKQAQEGRFFFENRFTTEEQQPLTVNLYFWFLGNVAKLTGIPIAMHLGRLLFGLFFLMALFTLIRRTTSSELGQKVTFLLAIFGAGTGWLYWERYGNSGPIDVWQTEAFTFPSLMYTGLFCAGLWLMVTIWNKILDAREHRSAVIPGFLCVLFLTNIHTYDTLTLGLVGIGFLASQIAAGNATPVWVGRSALIALGGVPSALWFIYVRSQDPVFAARAATETYSPNIMNVLVGYGPLFLLALLAFWISRYRSEVKETIGPATMGGLGFIGLLIAISLMQSNYNGESFWVGFTGWLIFYVIGIILCIFMKPANPVYGLLFSWMILGIIIIYYPDYFQRKLTMGLSIPIGILAGLCLYWLLDPLSKPELKRSLATLFVIALSITSAFWISREILMARDNISKTTQHAIYYGSDVKDILEYLSKNADPSDNVLIATPGMTVLEAIYEDTEKESRPVSSEQPVDATQEPVPEGEKIGEEYILVIPDLNPIASGWGGVKTYAGHWSETPQYSERRAEMTSALFTDRSTTESIHSFLKKVQPKYLLLYRSYSNPSRESLEGYKHTYKGQDWELYERTK